MEYANVDIKALQKASMCECLRKVERLTGTGTWVRCSLYDLDVGDVFRMFEDAGKTAVQDANGNQVWVAFAPPNLNSAGLPEVTIPPCANSRHKDCKE